jgi:malate/lactate dehydrogenase
MLAAVLLVGTALSAANPLDDMVKNEEAALEIAQLLENPNFEYEDATAARVTLMVNEDGELEIIKVYSENKRVEGYVKTRLNHKKLSNSLEKGKRYTLPVVFNSVE